jgi:hypothetical protein
VDDQIYLVPGEPYQPDGFSDATEPPARRRAFWTAVLLVILAVAVAVQHYRAAQLPVPEAAAAAPAVADTQPPPWPQGVGVCGSPVNLAQVSWVLPSQPSRTTVPVGGALPGLVNVDTGQRSEIPGLQLRPDQYVSQIIRSGPVSYVLVRNCQRRWRATVVRAQAGRPQQVIAGDRAVYGLIGDETGAVWAEAYTGAAKISPAAALGTTLVRLDRPAPAVDVPVSLNVIGLSGNQVVATAAGPPRSVSLLRLYRYDLTTRRAVLLGMAYSETVSRGVVLWTSTPCSAWGACALRSYHLRTGQDGLRKLHLPLGSRINGGVLSPDGRKLAFALERETPDNYYRSSSPDNPADLVVLDLTTGFANPVPDLELAPGVQPDSLGFSADSQWLIATLPADGGAEDIYSWRPGMSLSQFTPHPEQWQWPGLTEKQVSPQ